MLKPAKPILITIDGPGGAGKTSVSRRLADRLGYRYIDTGALYRAVGLHALEAGDGSEVEPEKGHPCAAHDIVRRAGFGKHHLWATPYVDGELHAAGPYTVMHEGQQGLPELTADGNKLERRLRGSRSYRDRPHPAVGPSVPEPFCFR